MGSSTGLRIAPLPHEKREAFDPPIDASGFGLGFCTALVPLSEAAAFFGSGFPPRRRVCAGAPATRSACEAGGWRRSHRNNCRAEVLGLVQSAMSLTWPWRSEPGPFLLATVPRFRSMRAGPIKALRSREIWPFLSGVHLLDDCKPNGIVAWQAYRCGHLKAFVQPHYKANSIRQIVEFFVLGRKRLPLATHNAGSQRQPSDDPTRFN